MKFINITASDSLSQAFAKEIVKKSPLLNEYIEFFTKPGNAVSARAGGNINGVTGSTRALGGDYTAKEAKPVYVTGGRKFVGDKIVMDRAFERMGFDLKSEMLSQLMCAAQDFGLKFNYHLINGDSQKEGSTEFGGLKELVNNNRVITAATNGLSLALGNSDANKTLQQTFLEKINETIGMCDGLKKVIITNSRVISRLNSVAMDYITTEKNEFGVPIRYYDTIPILDIGEYLVSKDTYAPIIGFNETCGTASNCASLYVVSFEQENGLSFATTPGGFTVYPTQMVNNNLETNFELIVDSMLIRKSALSKLSGLKL